MQLRSDLVPTILAFLIGAADWELVRRLGTRREAWDDPVYWQLGLVWRERPWRWVVWLMVGQAAWSLGLALSQDGIPNLLPLGLVMFALLGIPCLVAAYAGRWLGEKTFA
jgi:hypothetical protein